MNFKNILKKITLVNLLFGSVLFAQNIDLPDLTTVISGESVKAGTDSLPDFKNVVNHSDNSGKVVPMLPDIEVPLDATIDMSKTTEGEKTVFAEGLIGGGYPTLFTGDFSVFRLSGNNPFKLSFSHDSAAGYATNSLQDGFSDRTTNLLIQKGYKKDKIEFQLDGSYKALFNGSQKQIPGITGINQNIYAADSLFNYQFQNNFSAGIKADLDLYNRYADVSSGSYAELFAFKIVPELFGQWSINDFTVGVKAGYLFQTDMTDVLSGDNTHRGEFGVNLVWDNSVVKLYGNAFLVAGNQLNNNNLLVPFTVGVEASLPVSFSTRSVGLSAEGGLASKTGLIGELETKYLFSQLQSMPSEISDWYGKIGLTIPVKNSFTAGINAEYKQTAFGNGTWQPVYSETARLYDYEIVSMHQLLTEITLAYTYKLFTISGSWHSSWMDVAALESSQSVSVAVNVQNQNSLWGANAEVLVNLNENVSVPVINLEGFVRLTSTVSAVLSVQDLVCLVKSDSRVYDGNFISRGGTATVLLKFFF